MTELKRVINNTNKWFLGVLSVQFNQQFLKYTDLTTFYIVPMLKYRKQL